MCACGRESTSPPDDINRTTGEAHDRLEQRLCSANRSNGSQPGESAAEGTSQRHSTVNSVISLQAVSRVIPRCSRVARARASVLFPSRRCTGEGAYRAPHQEENAAHRSRRDRVGIIVGDARAICATSVAPRFFLLQPLHVVGSFYHVAFLVLAGWRPARCFRAIILFSAYTTETRF